MNLCKVRKAEPDDMALLERMKETIPESQPMQPIEPHDDDTLWKHAEIAQALIKVSQSVCW